METTIRVKKEVINMTIVLITAVLVVIMYGLYVAAYISENLAEDNVRYEK